MGEHEQDDGWDGHQHERYGLDRDKAMAMGAAWTPLEDPKARGPLTGIWRSTYSYPSSSRDGTFTSEHFVVLIQHGARLQVRSVPASESVVIMDLTVNGQVITGTWTEQTNPDGYYQGSVYHGSLQFLLDPTGHRMTREMGRLRPRLRHQRRPVDPGACIKRHRQGRHGPVQPATRTG